MFVCACVQVMESVTVASVCAMRVGQVSIATAALAHTPVSQRTGRSAADVESVYAGSASVLFRELQGISVRSVLPVEMSVALAGTDTFSFPHAKKVITILYFRI